MFTQVSLSIIVGIAAWGPLFGGLGLLVFGNFIGVSDIRVFWIFSGWRYPRLVGFILFCCGLPIAIGGTWLIWLLGE